VEISYSRARILIFRFSLFYPFLLVFIDFSLFFFSLFPFPSAFIFVCPLILGFMDFISSLPQLAWDLKALLLLYTIRPTQFIAK
jgi:hypothetical protein